MSSIMRSEDSFTDPNSKVTNKISLALYRKQRRWEVALYISLAFLAAAVLFGIAAVMFPWLGLPGDDPITIYFGRCLLILVFPDAFFVAHCLDKVKEARTAIRIEYCKQHGMSTDDG